MNMCDNWCICCGDMLIYVEVLWMDGVFDVYCGIGCLGMVQVVVMIFYIVDDVEVWFG